MFRSLLKFFVYAFAVAGFLTVGLVGLGIWAVGHNAVPRPKPPEKIILVVNFNENLVEKYEEIPTSLRSLVDTVTSEGQLSLHDVVYALERGSKDKRVQGIVALFGANLPRLAQSQEIRAALEKFRASGKFAIAFSESYGGFGPANNAYYLASAFEQVWLQPVGNLGLSGLRMEQPFAKTALEKFGVKAHFVEREEYKSAMQFLSQDGMTAPVRVMMQSILDDLNGQLAAGIAVSRKLPLVRVQELMAKGPYTAQEALERKLVDKVGYLDEIEQQLDGKFGKKAAKMRPDIYASLPPDGGDVGVTPKATVALIFADGEIKDGGRRESPWSGGGAMDPHEIATAFQSAADNKDVKLILMRVDSPGGSPTASETIRRAVTQAQAKGKKVIVSMGAMAGSGGYWIAMNGDRIFADPATLTGSIGVVAGKFVLAGLFEKLGVKWDVLKTGDYTGLWSTLHDYTPEEQARMDVMIDDTYRTFRDHVSKARKIPAAKMPDVSKGRIFTGAQAVKIGLVDELGGLRDAVLYAKTSLGLKSTDPIMLQQFPAPMTVEDRVTAMLRQYFERGIVMPDFKISLEQAGQWLTRAALMPASARMPYWQMN